MPILVSKHNDTIRDRFFRAVFRGYEGWIGVAAKQDNNLTERYFKYPSQLADLLAWINSHYQHADLYFSPMLFGAAKRKRANVIVCPVVWAEFDGTPIDDVDPPPSVIVESSPNKYHLLWFMDEPLPTPQEAETISRKIAYTYEADKSGWDLSQLLRIPITHNYKYPDEVMVQVRKFTDTMHKPSEFTHLKDKTELAKLTDLGLPNINGLDANAILGKYGARLAPAVFNLYNNVPDNDWSSALWALEALLFEAGLTNREVFVVAREAACNKYKRDDRPEEELWIELLKAEAVIKERKKFSQIRIEFDALLEEGEYNKLGDDTFVERYIEWAKSKTDAAPQYHQAGAFTILSAILCESVVLPTSAGDLIPNLWFMLLGDTTLTRKTTAMGMALRLLSAVHEDALMATDATIEGLLTELANRTGRASLFWRDEFSGMLEQMQKKDYQSGMMEMLAKLYDGERQRRVLRKETVDVRDPRFILFAGGIKSRILELFSTDHIVSGFIPRFVFINADADKDRYRPLGPSTAGQESISAALANELSELRGHYNATQTIRIGDQQATTPKKFIATLTDEAWARYNLLEQNLVFAGSESDSPELLTPTLDRLCKSTLKSAVLLAASRQRASTVTVELQDVLRAIAYLEQWKDYSIDVVVNAGKSFSEKTIDRAMGLIKRGRNSRSSLMNSMHLSSRDANLLIETMEQRGLISVAKQGKGQAIFPL